MDTKRILVVDDDPDMLFLVAHGIKSLSPNYQVSTAASVAAALEQVNKLRFDLVVTDYMMPEMTGLDLVPKVRQLSPNTQFVVMTAHHESNRLRNVVDELDIGGFVSKPFVLPELLDVIRQVTSQATKVAKAPPTTTEWPGAKVDKFLGELRRQISARNVLLVNAEGEPVHVIGENDPAKMARLASFVASNFLAITELATLFGDNNASFKSSYYEGSSYNIYAYNLNGEHFLAVVFDAEVKPGSVWFYTKQVAEILRKLLPTTANALDNPSRDTLAKDFNDILG